MRHLVLILISNFTQLKCKNKFSVGHFCVIHSTIIHLMQNCLSVEEFMTVNSTFVDQFF
jgi:hypothetical protein